MKTMLRVVSKIARGAVGAAVLGASMSTSALVIHEDPNNGTPDRAQNVDGSFSNEFQNNIEAGFDFVNGVVINQSTTIPHVSVLATGDDSFDWFSFTVPNANTRGIFDIDDVGDQFAFDSFISLFEAILDINGDIIGASAVPLAVNDDMADPPSPPGFEAPGIGDDETTGFTGTFNSFIAYDFQNPGVYLLEVTDRFQPGVPEDTSYTLHISLEGVETAVPLPGSSLLFLAGALGFGLSLRKPRRLAKV